MKAHTWMMQYGVAVLLALMLGFVLGHIPLFKETTIGKLRAADLVQFLGYGGALVMVWMSGRHVASDVPDEWKRLLPFRDLLIPVITLCVLSLAYGVLLLVCDPLLSKSGRQIYNWMFVAGLIGTSLWVIVTWLLKSAPLVASHDFPRKGKRQPA